MNFYQFEFVYKNQPYLCIYIENEMFLYTAHEVYKMYVSQEQRIYIKKYAFKNIYVYDRIPRILFLLRERYIILPLPKDINHLIMGYVDKYVLECVEK